MSAPATHWRTGRHCHSYEELFITWIVEVDQPSRLLQSTAGRLPPRQTLCPRTRHPAAAARQTRYQRPEAPGARYSTPPPRRRASSASSTVSSLVVETFVIVPVEVTLTSRLAAMTSSGASVSTYPSASPNACQRCHDRQPAARANYRASRGTVARAFTTAQSVRAPDQHEFLPGSVGLQHWIRRRTRTKVPGG